MGSKFKNKHSRQSFTYAYPRIKDNHLWLPKHKSWIKFSDGRTIEGKLKKVTDGTNSASTNTEHHKSRLCIINITFT